MILRDKNSIYEALLAGRVKSLVINSVVAGDSRIRELAELAKNNKVPVHAEAQNKGKRGRGFKPSPLEALCLPFEYTGLDDLKEKTAEKGKRAIVVALDHIQDPRNLGAIIRTVAAAGGAGVIIEKKRCCEITETVYETSCGGAQRVPIVRVSNLRQSLMEMKKWGFWIAGADEKAKKTCFEADFSAPLVLVLGGEGEGLSRIIREECDFITRIPTSPEFPSLNISVAASALIFEAVRQKSSL